MAVCHSFCLFIIFFYCITYIQSSNHIHTIHSPRPLSISSSLSGSVGKTSLWCRAGNRTRACLPDIRCQTFFVLWPKICPAVLWDSCENRNRGVGGGLLLLAACTDGPLLLVQQARESMSQPAECAVNWPTEVGRNPSLQQIFKNEAFVPTPRGYIEHTLSGFWSF